MRREAIPHALPRTQLAIAGPPNLDVRLVHKDVATAARTASGVGWLDEPEIGDAAFGQAQKLAAVHAAFPDDPRVLNRALFLSRGGACGRGDMRRNAKALRPREVEDGLASLDSRATKALTG